jgi:hypothetical protein
MASFTAVRNLLLLIDLLRNAHAMERSNILLSSGMRAMGYRQGDQIGRIFVSWAIVFFGCLFEDYRSSPKFLRYFNPRKQNYVLSLTNYYYILGGWL